jgi:uncharacterized protein YjdB
MRIIRFLLVLLLLMGNSFFSKVSTSYAQDTVDSLAQLETSSSIPIVNERDAVLEVNTSESGEGIKFNGTSIESIAPENPSINYATYVQDNGWLNTTSDGNTSGTEGQSKRLESIMISISNIEGLGVKYSTHVQDIGWLNFVSDGQESGPAGASKRIEAIKIELTGAKASNFDLYYRVHVQDFGWMDWVKNGQLAGTTQKAKRMESIKMVIVVKGSAPPTALNGQTMVNPSVSYRSHIQGDGWLPTISNGNPSGEIGHAKLLEAIQISLKDAPHAGGISYKTHVQDYGWLPKVSNGETSGKIGENKRVEAIQVELTGDMVKHFDVYYRAYSDTFGWLGWAKNGEVAGTMMLSKQLEAVEIVLVKKGGEAPGSTEKTMLTRPSVSYSTHVETFSWLGFVTNGALSGTSGQGKRLEAIKISLQNSPYNGDITYSTFIQDEGWANAVTNGAVSGTVGKSKRIEAIKIKLSGDLADYYDVYYRVHSQNFGWLSWAKNGEPAGTDDLALRMEAIQIVLIDKGKEAPGSIEKPFITKPTVSYSSNVESSGWQGFVSDGSISGTNGEAKRLEAIKILLQSAPFNGDITYTTHIQDYGWVNSVTNGEISGSPEQGKRIEAIKIDLTDGMAKYFDVYYRAHVETYGWLGWAKNGMKAGSEGLSKRLEAIEIKLVPKGTGPIVSENTALKQRKQSLTVFLDPGHGGWDPGAVAGGIKEAELNLAVAKKVKALLVERGYVVYMSRENDSYVDLLDRPKMANSLKTDIFVSIHTNSTVGASTTVSGIESYYYKYDSAYPSKINTVMHNNPERIKNSISLTNLIQNNMINYTSAANRGTDGSSFAVIREASMPATLIEMGFINNSSDRQKLITVSYQNILAKAITDGIDKYFFSIK